MKKSIGKSILSCLLVVSMIIPSLSYVIHTQAADGDVIDYDAMTMEQILERDESLTWVFAGDSITHNGSWSGGMNSYSEWFEQYLYDIGRGDDLLVLTAWGGAEQYDFQTPENTPANEGSNANSGMGLESMITKYNPDVIFIKEGMNDRGKSTNEFVELYNQMLDGIYAAGKENGKKPKVVILTPTPLLSENYLDDMVHGQERDDQIYESILRYRNKLEEIANQRGLLFVDLRTAFVNEGKRLGEDYARTYFSDSSDGLHPNVAGQYLIFRSIFNQIGEDFGKYYDSEMPIFQFTNDDLLSEALYVGNADDLTYENNYGSLTEAIDNSEMNKTMPELSGVSTIASVDFTSATGCFNGGTTYEEGTRFDLTDAEKCNDALTVEEVQGLTNTFSVVFRAKLEVPNKANQPVLFVSPTGTANWNNAISLGVQGTSDQWYYEIRNNSTDKTDSTNTFSTGNTGFVNGNWHTVAVVQEADAFKIYLDGTLISTKEFDVVDGYNIGAAFANATDFVAHIGSYGENAGTYQLKGKFDYWQFYSSALTNEQVQSLSTTEVVNLDWAKTVEQCNIWAVAGANQMSGYEGVSVHRSIFRYLDNAMRGGANATSSMRDIRLFNLASLEYNGVSDILSKFDSLTTDKGRNYDVFLLLPEIPNVYEEGYEHSTNLVATYKTNVKNLIAKNSDKLNILWTPLASGDDTINGYISDYADAIREIVAEDSSVYFFDANRFMNENMEEIPSLKNNWFEDGSYVSPMCSVDVVYAFYTMMNQSGIAHSELSDHDLRYATDKQVFKGKYIRDYICSEATVSNTTVSVDISAIKAAYPEMENLSLAVLPFKGAGNYHPEIRMLNEVASVSVDGNVYTFEAPCADLHLAIYGEQGDFIYRFKDMELSINIDATIPERVDETPDGVYLNSLKVMSAPTLGFDKDTTEYEVELYQYQTYARVRATAQAGLVIRVNGDIVASNALSEPIKVDDGTKITVDVKYGEETKTYTLTCKKTEQPDIIITEVMQDGYDGATKSGADNYELVEIYNASGRDLNLKDYSIGFKKDYTYNTVTKSNGAEYPYYFMGNETAFGGNATYTGIEPLTKYSVYWEDKVEQEPDEVTFKADSTMVIWIKFTPNKTASETTRKAYGAALTYDTLRTTLEAHKGTHTLSVDIDGTETTIVPDESQLIVAELPYECMTKGLSTADYSRSQVKLDAFENNFYLDAFAKYSDWQNARGWLFILAGTAEFSSQGNITKDGDDIISAANFVRPGNTQKLSSVFEYDYTRGMSLVKNESYINDDLVGQGNTSDVMGYSNLTSFGAIEYWQKPTDFGDTIVPTITDKTDKEVAKGTELVINLDLADETDVRYATVYTRKEGETDFTAYTKDFVLEAGVKNTGVSADITNTTYEVSLGAATGSVEYYAEVVDGNGNVGTLGSVEEPLVINEVPKVIDTYSVADATEYIGDKEPTCKIEGYLFSGWYADAACKNTPITSDAEAAKYENVYALFVSEDVLGVRGQLITHLTNTDATDDETGTIRFVTSVDSKWYKEVGFNVSYDLDGDGESEIVTRASNKAYEKLLYIDTTTGETMDYYPDKEFSSISKYFKACTVKSLPENYYDMDFEVEPFWITPDGITVKAEPQIKRVNDGIAVHYEAKDDTTYYPVLEDAVNDANTASKDSTITVFKDAEVESAMTVSTNITIQNRVGRDITVYRGTGLATTNMFSVTSGATLKIAGKDDVDSIVLDGRTVTEAEASKKVTEVAGSTGALVYNSGTVEMKNMTAQYVRRTSGDGAVVQNPNSKNAVIKTDNAKFCNNSADANRGGVFHIDSVNGKSEFKNTIFESNYAKGTGGAICNHSPLDITNCKFTDNTTEANGGAIYGGTNQIITITGGDVDMAIFSGNKSSGSSNYGGAIGVGSGKIDVDQYKFIDNIAKYRGGAIYVTGSTVNSQEAYSEITNSYFENNQSTTNNGGAMFINGSGRVNVEKTNFYDNYASVRGGAICNEGGTVTFTTCDFTYNEAGTEGGAYRQAASGTGQLINCKFENNTASCGGSEAARGGGAIKLNTGSLTIDGCVIGNNTATGGVTFGHDIKLNTTTNKPTITNSTFNPSNVRDSAGTESAYTDGGGNTLVTE